MKHKLKQQVFFVHQVSPTETAHTVAWVDAKWKLKTGHVVTFFGDNRRWTVELVGSERLELHAINKRWKVGGL